MKYKEQHFSISPECIEFRESVKDGQTYISLKYEDVSTKITTEQFPISQLTEAYETLIASVKKDRGKAKIRLFRKLHLKMQLKMAYDAAKLGVSFHDFYKQIKDYSE